MKLLKFLGATVVSVCAFAGPALAGQNFWVISDASGQFPTATISNINYRNWYPRNIEAGRSFEGRSVLLTEHCTAYFGCGSAKGNTSLAHEGILWSLKVGAAVAVNFCLSEDGPISPTCGVEGSSQAIYKHWIAGCHVPGGGYTCDVTMQPGSHGDIDITYTLGLPSSIMKK